MEMIVTCRLHSSSEMPERPITEQENERSRGLDTRTVADTVARRRPVVQNEE